MAIYATYLFYGAIFLSVLLLVEGLYFFIAGRSAITDSPNRRLRMLARGDKREDVLVRLQRERPLPRSGTARNPVEWFLLLVSQAGIPLTARQVVIGMCAGTAIAGIALMVLWRSPLIAGPGAVGIGFVLPLLVLLIKRRFRFNRLTQQLPDAINIVVRSLRAGHPVPTSMTMVAREMTDPIGSEFGLVVDEMTYGLNLDAAMSNMARRIGVDDVRFMVVAVLIQTQVGGNLAEVLESISRVIRERAKMRAKIRALSAEGRFSAVLLSVLPFVLMSFIMMVRPSYYEAVSGDPVFMPILGVGVVLMIVGIIIMYRLVNFRV